MTIPSQQPPNQPSPPPVTPAAAAAPVAAGAGALASVTPAVLAALAAGTAPAVTAAAIASVLAPLGVVPAVAWAAFELVERRPATHVDLPPGPAVEQVLRRAAVYRAAYLVNAAVRIAQRMGSGQSLRDAVRHERHFLLLHRRAQRQRLRAAQQVDRLAARGHAWLTWHLGDATHHTRACVAAAGHPFPADREPRIGWPGSTHPGCACYPTPGRPPRRGQLTVDQVTAPLVLMGVD